MEHPRVVDYQQEHYVKTLFLQNSGRIHAHGRMGWDEYFVRHGHGVYVIDQASRGRSAANPSAINRVRIGKAAVDQQVAHADARQEQLARGRLVAGLDRPRD